MQSDEKLVSACLAGSKEAFEMLVRRYERPIRAVALGVLGDFHRAEDAAQDAFIRAWKKLPTLMSSSKNLKGDSIEAPEHDYQPFNMTLLSREKIIDRLGDVLTSIDVGGEQSRQFAHEIKILDELLRDLGWISKD